MRIIGLASSKGGVGKTTSSIHLAAALTGCGAAVLLVDLDPQGAVCPSLGLPDVEPDETSTQQLAGDGPPRIQVHPELSGLMVLGARPDVDHLQYAFAPGRLREFASQLTPVPDFVIVDLAPSMEPLTLWALNELDSVLVVVQATALSIRTIPTMLANITHHCERTVVEGLLINHMGIAGSFGQQVAQSIRDTFGDWVFPVEIPFDETLQQASLEGRSVWGIKGSPASEAFEVAAAELIGRTFTLRTGRPANEMPAQWEDPAQNAVPEVAVDSDSDDAWPLDASLFDEPEALSAPAMHRPGTATVRRAAAADMP